MNREGFGSGAQGSSKLYSETDIQRKEAELEQVITEYYKYDMTGLKAEIKRLLENETSKIDEDRKRKLEEIQRKFTDITSLSSDHIKQGSRHVNKRPKDGDQNVDEKFIEELNQYEKQYEQQVIEANQEKMKLRDELSGLESEIRKMRDKYADKETENKNLKYLLSKEEELAD